MVGSDAVLFDGTVVLKGGVAFVAVPSVVWELVVQSDHDFVAMGFGQNAGGGNGHVEGVAVDDTLEWQ